jgi:adenylate cyclase
MAQRFTLEAMAAVAETRDVECGAHIKRTQHYVKILADFLMNRGAGSLLTPDYIDLLFHSAPLHDVGKVGIPDVILFKPSKLTAEEFETMKLHSVYGQQIMKSAAKGSQDHEFLDLAAEIALSHHEKWDGSGYPGGLAGEAIPLSGRIMALADVYDALTSVRRYKRSFSHEEAHRLIIESRGTHFDPLVVDAYLILEEEFVHISRKFKDEEGAAFQLEPEADS